MDRVGDNYELRGIVSHSIGCAVDGMAGVYTDVYGR